MQRAESVIGARAPKCSSCNRFILPGERATKFPCPSCGKTTIIRCRKCRSLSVSYTCPACGFTGP
ncbi:MAG: zinc finger domain-containing protein [Fervidicoccaceae archaeon]